MFRTWIICHFVCGSRHSLIDQCHKISLRKWKRWLFVNSRFDWSLISSVNVTIRLENDLFLLFSSGIAFTVFFPLLQTFLFFNAIGGDPRDLHMAVVNDEAGDCNHNEMWNGVNYDTKTGDCYFSKMSCRYLYGFNDSFIIKVGW